jgi:molecular chaperone DnaJ
MSDYYDLLGVSKDASATDIKKAFRKHALKYHPDRNPGDRESEETFKKMNEAYACLSDPQKKANYDQYGSAEGMGANGFGFEGFTANVGDIFGDIFGDFFGTSGRRRARPAKGQDLRYDLELKLDEAVFGVEKKISIPRWENCPTCGGTGSEPGKDPIECLACHGSGQTKLQQGFFSIARTCSRCKGEGTVITDPCKKCKAQGRVQKKRDVSLKVPAGIDTGIRLRVTGEGEAGSHGGPYGDLYVFINVAPHPFFKRKDHDLHCEVPISFVQASLGGEIEVPTMEGHAPIKIPAGTPSGRVFHLRGKGVPRLGGYGKGDQFVNVFIDVPKKLTARQKELLREYAEISGDETAKGFMDKVKDMFHNHHEQKKQAK